MAVTDDLPLTLGRNLLSLTYESDITDRASRIAPIALPLGGEATLLGFARWAISAPDSDAKTFVALDPAGGAGPVGFGTGSGDPTIDQLIGWYVLLERTGESFEIVSTDAETQTIALATWSANLLAGERFQFRLTAPGTTFAPYTFRFGGVQIPIQDAEVSDLDGDVITVRDGWNSSFTPIATDNQHVGRSVRLSEFVASDNITGFDATGGVYTYSFADVSAYQVGDWMRRLVSATAPYGDSLSPRFPAAMTIVDVDTDANTVTVVSRDGRNRVITDDIGIGFVGARIYRPTATLRTIIASSGSAHTLTLDETTGFSIAGGLGAVEILIAETTSSGKVPWFLEHPTFVQPYPTGIGVKFRTIDRTQAPTAYLGLQNLVTNGVPNTWTTETELPDGYLAAFTIAFGSGAPGVAAPSFMTVAKNLDPLYIKAGKQSLFFSTTRGVLYFPPIPWTPMYAGQRFSVRVPLFLTRWENTSLIQLLLGIVESDGTVRPWYDQARTVLIQPASASSPRADPPYHKFAANVWDDLVLNDFDITEPSTQPIVLRPTATDIANMGGGRGLLAMLAINDVGGTGGATVEGYVGGIAIVQGHEAPPNVQEYYEANKLHQDTNTVLKRPPQFTIGVDFHDAKRMNPTLDEPDAARGVVGLFNEPSLGVVNVRRRITDVVRNMVVPGETRITASPPRTTLAAAVAPRPATTPPPITSGGGGTTPGGSTMPTIALRVVFSGGIPTVFADVDASVRSVQFAATLNDAEPTTAAIDAAAPTVTIPFTLVGPPLSLGDVWRVGATAKNANGDKSAVARVEVTIDLSTPYLYTRSRTNYFQDASKTVVAALNDPVYTWGAAPGTTRDLVHRYPGIPGFRPLVQQDGAAVRFGDELMNNGPGIGITSKRGAFVVPDMSAMTEAEIILVVQRAAAPVSDFDGGALFQLGAQGNDGDYFPSQSDGHWRSTFGSTKNYDIGPLASAIINGTDGPHVIRLLSSATRWAAYLDGNLEHEDLSPSPAFDQTAPVLGENVLGGHFNGWVWTVLLFDAVNSDAQADAWMGTVLSDAIGAPPPGDDDDDEGGPPPVGGAAGDDGDVQYNNGGVLAGRPFRDFGRWEPLTNADPDDPDLLYADGDVVMAFRPGP